jgi:hypothetical protein
VQLALVYWPHTHKGMMHRFRERLARQRQMGGETVKLTAALLLLLALAKAGFAETRFVDGRVTCKQYDNVKQEWLPCDVNVYVDDDQRIYIRTEGGSEKAAGWVPGKRLAKITSLLKKSKKWSEQALEQRLEIANKPLGSFYTESGQGILLTFFAGDKGQYTSVVMDITDFTNTSSMVRVLVEPEKVRELRALLKKVPATHRKLMNEKKKARVLK